MQNLEFKIQNEATRVSQTIRIDGSTRFVFPPLKPSIILILEEQILRRPKFGMDGLYLCVQPIQAKQEGVKYAL